MTTLWNRTGPTGQGIALRILAGFLLAAMMACVKVLSDSIPLGQIVFFRSFFGMVPLVVYLVVLREFPSGLRTRRPMGHILRSVLGGVSMFASFAAVARLTVAETTLLSYMSPLFMSFLAVLLMGERLTPARLAGLVLGLSAVLVLTLPEIAGDWNAERLTGIALGLCAGILTALAMLQVRHLTRTEHPGAIAFYFALIAAIGGLATLPLGWVMPQGLELVVLIAAGLFGGLAHIATTLSLKLAEASAIAPFEYLTLIWAVMTDLLLFGTPIGPAFFLSVPLLMTGAAVAANGSRRRK
ncbi:MAG: DMT family transporter [Rhodobacteraceae bacterium]|nr:DMT family transporter [Paracoccaceae bacterium]